MNCLLSSLKAAAALGVHEKGESWLGMFSEVGCNMTDESAIEIRKPKRLLELVTGHGFGPLCYCLILATV